MLMLNKHKKDSLTRNKRTNNSKVEVFEKLGLNFVMCHVDVIRHFIGCV